MYMTQYIYMTQYLCPQVSPVTRASLAPSRHRARHLIALLCSLTPNLRPPLASQLAEFSGASETIE